jgi:hypothetical protein
VLGLLQKWERDITWDEHLLRYHSGDAHQARLFLFMGWRSGALVAAVAGIVAAVVVGNCCCSRSLRRPARSWASTQRARRG